MDLEALAAAGLYDPSAPDAPARAELLEHLVDEGCSVEEMLAADARGRLFGLGGDRFLLPAVGLLSLRQVAAELAVQPARVLAVWSALGLTVSGLDAPALSERDVEAVRTSLLVEDALGVDAALGLARVVGAALARVAEAEASAMRTGVQDIVLGEAGDEVVTARAYTAVASLVPRIGLLLDAVHRQHLLSARDHFEQVDLVAGSSFRCSVGFADLSGFTRLSQELELEALSRLLTAFEAVATDTVHAHGGRVVKFLGDAVMWVAGSVDAHATVACRLVEEATARGLQARAGLAWGAMLAQDGDWFGPPVNLAARLVAVAEPGQVLASSALVDQLAASWAVDRLADVELRGFDQPVPVFAIG